MISSRQRGAGRRHRRLRGGLIAAGATASLLTAGTPAMADYGATHVVNVLTPVIEIEGDGKVYTKPVIPLVQIAASVNVTLDAHVSGRIKSYKVWLKFRTENSDWAEFPQHSTSQSFPLHERPKKLNNNVYVGIPYGSHASYLVAYCNLQANALRHGGMSDQEIFSQDRPIEVGIHSALEYEMSGASATGSMMGLGGAWETIQKMNLICKAKPPARTGVAEGSLEPSPPEVEQATLAIIEQHSLHGACSVHLSGTLRTAKPNSEVKFLYVDSGGRQSDLKTVTTDHSATAMFSHEYPLSEGGIRSGKIQIVGQGPAFLSNWADYEVNCGSPAQGITSMLPPKATALEAHALPHETVHQGFACPKRVRIFGVMQGRGTASGAAALFAADKLKKLQQYSIEDGQTVVVEGEHDLDWSSVHAFGGAVPQQSVKLTMNVTNALADLVDHMEVTQKFACRETTGVAEGAVGGISPGAKPDHSQQAAVGQVAAAPALAVMAPKGPAHSGEIRLSGGAANAKYKLTFLRKSGGGYVAVNAAQLPKQMTGLVASFPLKALSGGRDWRLEVCPLAGAPTACMTSDFRLPRIGGAGAGAGAGTQVPAPAAGSTVYIVPGVLN
ncbi:MAG: hypothetical protein ACFCUW_12305 [Kiloniellaceae bacterium]